MELPAWLSVSRIIGVVLALVFFAIAMKVLKPKADNQHVKKSRCANCGWTGEASKYKPVCPQCARPLV